MSSPAGLDGGGSVPSNQIRWLVARDFVTTIPERMNTTDPRALLNELRIRLADARRFL